MLSALPIYLSVGTAILTTAPFSILVGAVLFGLIHALHVDPALHLHFDATAFAVTGIIGTDLAILTLNSGSIFLPVIAHNLANCLGILL
jgi:membrane protease YdiL (CAAX protease family)